MILHCTNIPGQACGPTGNMLPIGGCSQYAFAAARVFSFIKMLGDFEPHKFE